MTLVLLVSLAAVSCALASADSAIVGPREIPRHYAPFSQIETHRIRIDNIAGGLVEVSADAGVSWRTVGRVTAPATDSLSGYLASGYAAPGTVAAVAVHGLRIRVGDLTSAYPKLINILPLEFAQTPVFFGGHIAGDSGIYTDIAAGTSIFRDLSPYSGNPVLLTARDGSEADLPTNYHPAVGDILTIIVKRPANPLVEVDFPNVKNMPVLAKYSDGTIRTLTTVLKPVYGIGRYDGTSYTGVGAINTSHTGVLTISTAPVTESQLLEGVGPERRGGFQITPSYHNTQSDEAWAASVMVLGRKHMETEVDLEGTPPLFLGYFDLGWMPDDPDHSWRAQVQYGKPVWQPMPQVIGTNNDAMRRVTAIRVVRSSYGDRAWIAARLNEDVYGYHLRRLADARAGRMPVDRGSVTVSAGPLDPRTRFVAYYVDGALRGITNAPPFRFIWDTNDSADGDHSVEVRQEDGDNGTVVSHQTTVWVDNQNQISVSGGRDTRNGTSDGHGGA
ncbi:MAG: hypothetical protein ACLQVD_08920 [Capsulimonadaceae bacterium]